MFFNRWMTKQWYIHTMEYYSAVKGNKLLIRATMLMSDLENLQRVTLREKKANQKKLHTV